MVGSMSSRRIGPLLRTWAAVCHLPVARKTTVLPARVLCCVDLWNKPRWLSSSDSLLDKKNTSAHTYQCSICLHTFTNMAAYLDHTATAHHSNKPHLYKCPTCGQRFAWKNSLRRHQQSKHAKPTLPCSQCGMLFSRKDVLKRHETRCQEKAKAPPTKTVKPYKCHICDKSYSYAKGLARHQLSHTGVKQHSCPYCVQKFVRKDQLIDHLRLHTGEKPYCCPFCPRRFTQVYGLRQHLKVMHPEKNIEELVLAKTDQVSSQS